MTAFFSRLNWLAVCGLLLLGGCVEPYLPAVPASTQALLVVDGYIASQGVTTIQLSRSLALTATASPPAETKATLAIQAAGGQRFALTEGAAGTYSSASLTLDPAQTYQLTIRTAAGREYASELNPVKTAPPIDQVHWRYENDGVQLYADAHDASRATTYYRWQYEQTWQFTSAYQSHYQYDPLIKEVVKRPDDIYHCWHTENSTTVRQTSTARLSQDAVLDYPLVLLPGTGEQLRYKYSILVKLLAESKEEYDYWDALRKNTESLGSINDPLPTQLTGNVHCLSDPTEPVLGFVGVHSLAQQRLFIARTDVPQLKFVRVATSYDACKLIYENRCPKSGPKNPPGVTYVFDTPVYLPLSSECDSIGCDFREACAYYGATAECVDCRLRGTNVQPSFWK